MRRSRLLSAEASEPIWFDLLRAESKRKALHVGGPGGFCEKWEVSVVFFKYEGADKKGNQRKPLILWVPADTPPNGIIHLGLVW